MNDNQILSTTKQVSYVLYWSAQYSMFNKNIKGNGLLFFIGGIVNHHLHVGIRMPVSA